jgi:hypothetical protein
MSARSASRKSRSAPPEYWRQLFAEWVQKAYWHPEEAAAVSLRLDPEYLRLVSPTELDTAEEYAIYRERIDLIERLQRSRNEPHGPNPKAFLEWALSIQLEIPEDLKSVIERLTGSADDWRTKFQAAQAHADELQRLLDECRSTVDRLKKSDLEDKRLSLQKMAIGMAAIHYDYSPTKRNAAAGQIADALYQLSAEHADAGPPLSAIRLDEDTVRKHLKAAADDLDSQLR